MKPDQIAQTPPRPPQLGDIVIACLGDPMAIGSPLLLAPAVVTQHMAKADNVPDGAAIEASIIVGGLAAQAMPVAGPGGKPMAMPRVQPAHLVYSQTVAAGTWRYQSEYSGPSIVMPGTAIH